MSSARALAGQSGDRKRKREGGENSDRKGGDRSQQQAACSCAADFEDKRKAGREGGRADDVEDKRGAGQSSGLARGAAARRRRGHDDAATIAATANIRGRKSVRERVANAERHDGLPGNPMRVCVCVRARESIYTTRTLTRTRPLDVCSSYALHKLVWMDPTSKVAPESPVDEPTCCADRILFRPLPWTFKSGFFQFWLHRKEMFSLLLQLRSFQCTFVRDSHKLFVRASAPHARYQQLQRALVATPVRTGPCVVCKKYLHRVRGLYSSVV